MIAFLTVTGRDRPGLLSGTVIVGTALVLAEATHPLIERPLEARVQSVDGGMRIAALGTIVALLAAAIWQVAALSKAEPQGASGDPAHAGGARAARSQCRDHGTHFGDGHGPADRR